MSKADLGSYKSFDEICERLDEIVETVKNKDTSLEKSLDYFDEAIALGSRAVDMVDQTAFSPEEEARIQESQQADVDNEQEA